MKRAVELAAGSATLNLVDTISNRGSAEVDLIATPEAFGDWLVRAGVVKAQPKIKLLHLKRVQELRAAVFRCASAILAGKPLPPTELRLINAIAAMPAFRPQLTGETVSYVAVDAGQAALSTLAADAIAILSLPLCNRLRRCPDCGMFFVDRSRPGLRRWCSSSSGCGNRYKVREFRNRKTAEKGGS